MDDIRDQFPMPPCINCGHGMCEKDNAGESYRCPTCGQRYVLSPAPYGPINNPKAAPLGPLAVNLRLVTQHWMMAMGAAMDALQYDSMAEIIATHKRWLDEVGLPMADYVRKLKHGEQVKSLPATSDNDWLGDERLREIR